VAKTSDNFTLLRLILALLVVFSHSYPLIGHPEPTLFHSTAGGFAVQGFFAISGYLIAGSYLTTQHSGQFVWKRLLRIVPALAFAVPLPLLLYEWQDHYAGGPFPGVPNGSLWTISWEVLMYGLTLLLGLAGLLTAPVSICRWRYRVLCQSSHDRAGRDCGRAVLSTVYHRRNDPIVRASI
jgi:peptidoglycan/LPS O-acetylase OafA/YrhL